MSNVNYYRNNIERKTRELLDLKSKATNEQKKFKIIIQKLIKRMNIY